MAVPQSYVGHDPNKMIIHFRRYVGHSSVMGSTQLM